MKNMKNMTVMMMTCLQFEINYKSSKNSIKPTKSRELINNQYLRKYLKKNLFTQQLFALNIS